MRTALLNFIQSSRPGLGWRVIPVCTRRIILNSIDIGSPMSVAIDHSPHEFHSSTLNPFGAMPAKMLNHCNRGLEAIAGQCRLVHEAFCDAVGFEDVGLQVTVLCCIPCRLIQAANAAGCCHD